MISQRDYHLYVAPQAGRSLRAPQFATGLPACCAQHLRRRFSRLSRSSRSLSIRDFPHDRSYDRVPSQ
jgi:hypothetical protein